MRLTFDGYNEVNSGSGGRDRKGSGGGRRKVRKGSAAEAHAMFGQFARRK